MYAHKDSSGRVTDEFLSGAEIFMYQAGQTPLTKETGKMFCPCRKCNNTKFAASDTVWKHIVNRGFTPHYYIWFNHGEGDSRNEASSSNQVENVRNRVEPHLPSESVIQEDHMVDHDRMHDMVTDAFRETTSVIEEVENVEGPNLDAKRFYEMLAAANEPIYEGCREEYLPEENLCAESYYEIQKLVHSLGLPSEMIDVCIDNCMIYWEKDAELLECKFCKKPRYKPQGRGRNRVPYQRMWYLPIKDRLKRLYQSAKTAASMRWHAEHDQKEGEINHPSDAKAWKHLNSVYPDFASNPRNVYLGLCTDGFSPFGIDFPAYGMLSGWTTHGRLSCPYCMGSTDAFQLKNGRKTSWFDCHRRFLPINHPYRRNKKLFRSKRVVRDTAPPYLSGEEIEKDIDYYGGCSTVIKGGNWHTPANMPDGYGTQHNWHKKSIFWELPYWKDLLLRHNLDVMHIEKNFFDNIINTLLNVPGKTKDNKNSRLDLPALCSRIELHIRNDGRIPVPIFRLSAEAKAALFKWVSSDVKFSDGYVSNLSRCVDHQGQKFSGMKSHDCHVFMQRLLPFAFAELLPKNVHEALAGIGAFFRDLSARTLTVDVIRQLDENIRILMCNLEKIFPPSFFDVMEHLVIHLPYEALLRGPVHNGWMYPYERAMKYLKGKAKNLARVEGSIVAGSLNEETSHFTSYYFGSQVRTRKRTTSRYDDGGVIPTYFGEDVPDIFCQIGRLGGKLKEVWWSSSEDAHSAHTYILLNCEEIELFESDFVAQVEEAIPGVSNNDLNKRKDQHFVKWLKTQVQYDDQFYPQWFHELIQGPVGKVTTAPIYFTRGYTFHTYEYGSRRATMNYGVCVKGETDFYGIIQEIIEVEFPGVIKLKCVLFKCDWFDPTVNRGVRYSKFGVVDVNATRRYNKFEPYILASQADQVCFVPYPRIRQSGISWLAAMKVTPRGRVLSTDEQPPLQEDAVNEVEVPEQAEDVILLIDPHNPGYEELPEDTMDEANEDEFEENDEVDDVSDDE
ncbi:uncharacterized protein LOC130498122 [Raphanus sativus]|uniref:Uncharacterized protein LOC130498122 n=1 Tax=Raphanus sativus TaxID=3726 RepID=A0A9W3C7G4_RAPSA|nr:uncharacterized protein LOC130498122 [Raphanus sativus]